MTQSALLDVLAASAASSQRLNPVKLFLDADIVVQLIMVGLLLASVWVWTLIVSLTLRLNRVRSQCEAYEHEFWKSKDMEAFNASKRQSETPSARVVSAALGEWRRSLAGKKFDPEGVRQRLAGAMDSAVASEADKLGDRLSFLATVGSVAPFVGLFGTVWGIMNSFFQIGEQQNSSLAVVAPGISEALFATAIGLFAAIPAVIAYNRFSHKVNSIEARLQRFATRVLAAFSRDLEKL